MIYKISNDILDISISTRGAELQSIKRGETEYLWQGDVRTWQDKAINLFPYIARLTEGRYSYQGKSYKMEPHGFLSSSELEVEQQQKEQLTFCLHSNDDTYKSYPFAFDFRIHYRLADDVLQITYEVENLDEKTMYFGIGGHPGFRVPLEEGLEFQDYRLEFQEPARPLRVGMSDTCYVTGKDTPFPLENDKTIRLSHELFDNDAIILRDMCKAVTLYAPAGQKSIRVAYPDMKYLGIWHWPHTAAEYVCIEPWSSLPSRDGIIEDLEIQGNLISLSAGAVYKNSWNITIT